MSKKSFTNKLIFDMYNKLESIDDYLVEDYLDFDETLELALSLVYMTLSKEKLIDKEISNPDPLGRLTRNIPVSEIDSLFTGKYSSMIINTAENDNTWILDAIRDSIIHNCFDIDEANKLVLINNNYGTRILNAEIPYEWFKDYIKSDIVRKKTSNKYVYKNFYYNNYINKDKRVFLDYAIDKNILYNIYIEGADIPIKETDDYIRDLMSKYSVEEYNNYSESFNNARRKLIRELKAKYPYARIKINTIKKKDKLKRKAKKKCLYSYNNYDELYDDLRYLMNRDNNLLNNICDMYSFVSDCNNLDLSSEEKRKRLLELTSYNKNTSYYQYLDERQRIHMLFLQLYGLVTIVLNESDLKNTYFPMALNSRVDSYSKKALIEYQDARRKIINNLMSSRSSYDSFKKSVKATGGTNKVVIENYKKSIQNYNSAYNEYSTFNWWPDYMISSSKDRNEIDLVRDILFNEYKDKLEAFYKASDKKARELAKKEVLKAIDKLSYYEKNNIFTRTNPNETMTVLRNCFAHNGRIQCSNSIPIRTSRLWFTDYNDDGELTGIATCKYIELIDMIYYSHAYLNSNDKCKSLVKHI